MRLTLELGGNDAAMVLPDVDSASIAEGLFSGAFINTGQTCANHIVRSNPRQPCARRRTAGGY